MANDLNQSDKANQKNSQGNLAYQEGNFRNAILLYTEAIELSPTSPEFYRNRSQSYRRLHETDKALQDVEKSIELESDNKGLARGYVRKGEVYFYLGLKKRKFEYFNLALEAFQKAYENDPVVDIKNAISETEYYAMWTKCHSITELE